MKNFDTRTYNISDFVEWNNTGHLELSPDFQRRSVWTEKAKSYLIDTIVRGKPMPKILISQRLQGTKNLRIVVDGQQRLRTLLEFYNSDFKISRVHNKEFAGKTFNTLPPEVQNEFLKYELGVDLLFDMSYEDILDVFARINSYTVKLTTQEIFNARYVGYFKQYVFEYGLKYVKYYLDSNIITKANVTRMGEAEMTADIFVSLIDTIRTNKNVENYYKQYEDDEGELPLACSRYDEIMSFIGAIYPPFELANTNWKRPQLFYTLFTAIGHCLFGLKGADDKLRSKIAINNVGKLRIILDEISLKFDEYTEDGGAKNVPNDYSNFINYSRRGTTDTGARILRTDFVCEKIKAGL